MTAMDNGRGTMDGLNERELEILRLLAVGHTSKSIAARLGRSETAINERLRAARRKTGIGSSRELARLLEAQEIWDRKIDLAAPAGPANGQGPPASSGSGWSKGTIAMLIALPFVAAASLLLASASTAPQAAIPASLPAASSPLAGSWSLDASRLPEAERPGRVTISFRQAPDGKWTTLVAITAPDGSSRHAESTAATDGVPVPIAGNMDFIDTAALRQPAPGTLVMTLGKNGTPVSTRVYTVAKDRKSMTETIVWAGGTLPKLETTYFVRHD
jgi:DNA-binding CsgD family transcriptional regulator